MVLGGRRVDSGNIPFAALQICIPDVILVSIVFGSVKIFVHGSIPGPNRVHSSRSKHPNEI